MILPAARSDGLLPPCSTELERGLEASIARLSDVPVPLRLLWNPATCPAHLLPWLAWGVSIDFWKVDWSEAQKRAAIAGAITAHRLKGTPASLRQVLDRFDPMIRLVEWFEDRDTLAPHTFRLELPLGSESAVPYNEELVADLLRDIAAVKPLRSHMLAVHALQAQAGALLLAPAQLAGLSRLETSLDLDAPTDSAWATYLLTEHGEPIVGPDGSFLKNA